MQRNLTLAEEDIVHENPCLQFHVKNKALRIVIDIISFIALFSPIFLSQYFGA